MRQLLLAAALALAACGSYATVDLAVPIEPSFSSDPVVLSGEITRADHQTYKEIPFTVPAGAKRINVDFTYAKDNRTVIDLGLRDPNGQRGWSGGNKSSFTIGLLNATPSYRSGILPPGEWKLVLGVPNIREGQTAAYKATITFESFQEQAFDVDLMGWDITRALSPAPSWRRGDFHTHTAHSDGSCDVAGTRGPCPATRTFEAARDAGLDFVVVTDHNTITQLNNIRFEQDRYPKTLLIPGTEITTFNGHANAIGNTDFLDFQLGSPRLPTLAKLFDQVDAAGGFLSINHPSLPSGEACMGCGWTVKDTDWSRVTAIEVVNGSGMRTGGPEGPLSGIRFWDNLLKQGHRITAIGGSDNHDATDRTGAKQPPIGSPTTVVYASELSNKGIIAGVKSGRVFLDVAGLPTATLEIKALVDRQTTDMGGEIKLADNRSAFIDVVTTNLPANAKVSVVPFNVAITQPTQLPAPGNSNKRLVSFTAKLSPGATSGYIRPEVRDPDGKLLLLLGNPIYIRR